MKVSIRNLGVIKEADISIGDLTVLCGWNNTGKTYVSSVLFGFLDKFWQNEVVLPLAFEILDSLRKNNEFLLTEEITRKAIGGAIKAVKEKFSNSEVFAEDIPGEVDLITEERDDKRVLLRQELHAHDIADAIAVVRGGKGVWKFKAVDKGLVADKDAGSILAKGISNFLKKEAYFAVLPRPFVASCERTGAMIFNADVSDVYKTAYFGTGGTLAAKMHYDVYRKWKTQGINNDKIDWALLVGSIAEIIKQNSFFRRKYPLPVGFDVFINRPAPLLPHPGSFAGLRPDILEALNGIVGGVFEHKDGKILFEPQVSEGKASLGSGTVSSSVRALFDLVIFLHVASPGDLLIIDEPEMNLHPHNQRLLARFLVRLCNEGVRVFISTHSDYILREFSILIMLDSLSEEPRKAIAKEYGYEPDEGLNHESCRVYRAVPKEEKGGVVFDPVSISPEFGIDGSVFDEVIEKMNAMMGDILSAE